MALIVFASHLLLMSVATGTYLQGILHEARALSLRFALVFQHLEARNAL